VEACPAEWADFNTPFKLSLVLVDREIIEFSKKLYDAFNKVVFLKPQRIGENVYSSSNLMRQALFDGMYKSAPQVLEHFGMDIDWLRSQLGRIDNPVSRLVFLVEYTRANFPSSHQLEVLDSPKTNVETNSVACTMATLMGAYLLDQFGFEDNFYIQPSGHSVNGVNVEGSEYYVDFANGVVLKIKRSGVTRGNAGDKAEFVEIIDPFGSGGYRLAVSSDRTNLSLSVAGNLHGLLLKKRKGRLELKGDDDEETKKMKKYFSELAKPFDGWDLKIFSNSKYRRFLSPALVALQFHKEMEEERKRLKTLQHDFAGEKLLSPKVIVNLVKRTAANLGVRGIDPTGEKIVRKIKSDPRYPEFRKNPRIREFLSRLEEKGGLNAVTKTER